MNVLDWNGDTVRVVLEPSHGYNGKVSTERYSTYSMTLYRHYCLTGCTGCAVLGLYRMCGVRIVQDVQC